MKKKKIIVITILIAILMSLLGVVIFTCVPKSISPTIRYNFDTLDIPVSITNDCAYIKIDDFMKVFNKMTYSFEDDKTIKIINNDMEIKITLKPSNVYVNGNEIVLENMPYSLGNEVYVPVKFVFETFGYYVFWDNVNYVINVISYDTIDSETPKLDIFSSKSIDKLKKITGE